MQGVHSFVGKSGCCTHSDNVLLTHSANPSVKGLVTEHTVTPETAPETGIETRHRPQKAAAEEGGHHHPWVQGEKDGSGVGKRRSSKVTLQHSEKRQHLGTLAHSYGDGRRKSALSVRHGAETQDTPAFLSHSPEDRQTHAKASQKNATKRPTEATFTKLLHSN